MGELANLQSAFARALVTDDLASFAPGVRGERDASRRHLAIYRHSVFANWTKALAGTFPVVERLVGEAFFREAARQFAIAEPSRSGDLNSLGGGFPRFLERYPHASGLPYLPDVARLEWACHESQMAADAEGLDFAALARVPADEQGAIRFRLQPAARLVESDYPVLALWEANQEERDGTPDRLEGGERVLVSRHDSSARLELLGAGDAIFLRGLARSLTLEQALEGTPDDWDVGERLRHFAARGVIAGFSTGAA
jgi:Putative DNA-binding domain